MGVLIRWHFRHSWNWCVCTCFCGCVDGVWDRQNNRPNSLPTLCALPKGKDNSTACTVKALLCLFSSRAWLYRPNISTIRALYWTTLNSCLALFMNRSWLYGPLLIHWSLLKELVRLEVNYRSVSSSSSFCYIHLYPFLLKEFVLSTVQCDLLSGKLNVGAVRYFKTSHKHLSCNKIH